MRVLGLCLLVGCTASAEDVRPPADDLYFPTGAVIAPDQSVLFVANANSELRYDSGSVSVIDLQAIDDVAAAWTGSKTLGDCTQDLDHIETLICDNAAQFIKAQSGVRIGNFATDLAVQELATGGLRLVIPTRGDPSIAWVDYDPATGKLGCNANGEDYALCDDRHRLSFVRNDADLSPIPEEPFGVFADSATGFAIVTHLTTGSVTLIDSPPDGGDAIVSDFVGSAFAPDPNTGLRGATGVVGRSPHTADDIVYVGSRSEDRIQTFTVARPVNDQPAFLLAGGYFFLDAVGSGTNQGGSTDTRGMAFSADGKRLFLVNRRPPSLQIYDTSDGPGGYPKNTPIAATDMCRQASTLTVADVGDGERVYVACFQDGAVYIVDPRGLGTVEDIVTVGRGPYSVVASPTRKKLYVTNFLEDTIAVVDLAPGPTRHRVVLRVNAPRAL